MCALRIYRGRAEDEIAGAEEAAFFTHVVKTGLSFEADETAVLKRNVSDLPALMPRSKGARYTPMAKRQDKPDAIAWILKHRPDLTDAQIRKLIGTTKNSIDAIRNKTHWNMANIKARNPVLLGLCTEAELERAVAEAPKSLKQTAAVAFDVEDADEE